MIAEYRPATGKYYYYMSDQINSTRIITDDAGAVVYSEAYGPYGDVQKTWTKNYDPKQKFSGKEREGYSELDYFGARYFDNNSYRFISVDPIINKEEALSNPQLWNLYAYCRNNPITHFDPDGRDVILLYQTSIGPERSAIPMPHTAILIGSDENGWKYFSKSGKNQLISGMDDNVKKEFDNLNEFTKSELGEKYQEKYRMKSDTKNDERMIKAANLLFDKKYSLRKILDKNGRCISFNCSDFTESVLLIGGFRIHQTKYGFTNPTDHYNDVKKNNKE
jgi:RHS repeat-associated protein